MATSQITRGERFSMEEAEKPVQNPRKGRSREAKTGRIKYTLEVQKQIRKDIEEIKLTQRSIFAGLRGLFNFQKPFIVKIACSDEVDREILDLLCEAGGVGMLPKDVAARLSSYGLKSYQVGRRAMKMNKRLQGEIGESVCEQRGWHWALTSFAVEVWDETREKVDQSWPAGELESDEQKK